MKRFTFITFFFSFLLTFSVFAQKGYINPTAKYAEMLGYRYEISSTEGGEVGIVHLPDGRMVNAWDFYKGKVAPEYSYGAKLGFDVETEVIKENGYITERAVCVRANRGVEERIPLLELMKLNGEELIAEVEKTAPSVHDIATVDPGFKTVRSLPTSFDWRNYNGHAYIGDPRDQGSCGSCYSFGAAAAAEGAYNVATGSYDNNTADFAEAYIAFCLSNMSPYSSHFDGCNGADYEYYELQALVDIGICNESYFPYVDATNQSCPSAATNAPKTKFESWHRVASSDVDAIKTAIMTYGVVDAAVYVTTSFSNYSGGVWSDSNNGCSNGAYTTTNHAISLVGWGNDATYGDYWILRNSWGSSWGESGYMRIAVNSAAVDCAVCYMVYQDVAQAPVAEFSASETTVLYGNSVSFTDESTNNPTSWSWSFEGGTPSTSNSQNPTVTYNTPGTYNVTLTATNAEGNDSETKTDYITVVDEIIPEYCTSLGSNFSYEWISSVKIGTFTNTSTAAGYTDFTSKTVNMTAGTGYAVTLTPGFASSTYNEYWKIWVDLNYDGDFDDSGELIFDAGALSKTAVTGTATIPSGTSAKTTRMRVSMKYNAAQTACETFSYGEVEDYTVNISTGGDTQAPTAPTNLAASSVTQTTLNLGWTASTDNVGVTGYDVYRNGSLLGSTSGTSYSVSGLTASTTYSFYVKAKDAAGNVSSASSTINVTTIAIVDTQAPTAPSNLSSSNITTSSVSLNWTASTDNVGVTGYDVYRNGTLLTTTTSTSYNVSGLSASTTYTFYVKAKDAAGNVSSASSTISVTTGSVIVEYCTSKGSNSSYEWISKVVIGTFTNSSTAAGYTDFTSKTVNLTAGSSVNVALTPGFSGSTYNEYWKIWIDYNNDAVFADSELAFDGGALSKTTVSGTMNIPSTASGTTRMRVSMKYNAAQTACETFSYGEVEDYTVTFGASVPDTQAPTVPTGLASSNITSSSATISWNASSDNVGVTGYEVYRNGSLISTVTTTSYSATGLTAATTYAFTVKAKDAAGNISAASSALNVTTSSVQLTYCTSKGNNVTYEWIDYVALGGMTNTTGANGGYADFTSKVATVTRGASVTASFSCGFKSSSYTEFWYIWIDWDQNGTFDSDELMSSGSSSSSATLTSTFTVPSTALLGSTRMRVTMKYNAAPTACETFTYGEVEDYTVNVTTANTFAKGTAMGEELGNEAPTSVVVYPNPADEYVNVFISNGSRVGTISVYNITGSLVKVVEMNGTEHEVSISELPAGTYIISVTDEKESLVKRFIKK